MAAKRLELWGPGEVVRALEVSRMSLKRWRERDDFPKPLAELEMGPVWLASDIRHWAETRSKPGT